VIITPVRKKKREEGRHNRLGGGGSKRQRKEYKSQCVWKKREASVGLGWWIRGGAEAAVATTCTGHLGLRGPRQLGQAGTSAIIRSVCGQAKTDEGQAQ